MKYFIILNLLFFSFSSFASSENEAKKILSKMTLSEKVNELFIFNIYKSNVDKVYKSILKKHRPGSYILFGRDIPSVKTLFYFTKNLKKEYKKYNDLPPLIMIDQEGGHVTRIQTKPNLPSPLSVSMSGDPALSYRAGSEIAKILKLLGINMNLAPVVDLSDPYIKNFIGNRSFGNDPNNVVKFASTQALAFEEQSIIPTFKHFPGHGGVIQDSHKKLPRKLSTLDELKKHDLKPFKELINKHPEASILIGHLAFPNIDSTGVPTTFSRLLLTDVLKEELKFKGLIITDDLQMKALKNYGSLLKRSQLAFNAGADLLMITGSFKMQKKILKDFKKLITNKKIPIERVDETVLKMIHAKLKLSKEAPNKKLSYKVVLSKLKNYVKNLKNSTDNIINNNLDKTMNKLLPIISNNVNSSKKIKVFSAYKSFYRQIKTKFPNKKFRHYYLSRKRGLSSSSFSRKKNNELNIFYATGLGTIRMLKRLPSSVKRNTIVINSTHPGALPNQKLYKNVININTPYSYSGKLFANFIKAKGKQVK